MSNLPVIIPAERQAELIDRAVEYLWGLVVEMDDIMPDLAGMTEDLDTTQARRWFAERTDVRDAYLISDLDYLGKFIKGEVPAPISPYWGQALTRPDLFKEQQYKFLKAFGALRSLQ